MCCRSTAQAIASPSNPAAPGVPNGQEGRQAIVFQLLAGGGEARALKVLKPQYRHPSIVSLAQQLAPFADLSGLDACRRIVLTEQRQTALLSRFPDLMFASLMPWIMGPTWMEIMLDKRPLSPEASLRLARSLAGLLAALESRHAAHCDLSAANVLLPALASGNGHHSRSDIALVDVEQLYGPDLARPDTVPAGSPGYGHRAAAAGVWGPDADRFAGAVLICEMAGWCDERVRNSAWGESYFDPGELGKDSTRYSTIQRVLRERWGEGFANLLGACPIFSGGGGLPAKARVR